jgi:predicted porin
LGQCFKIPLFNFWSLFMMKKTLVALAAAAATGAFAQVSITGTIDLGVNNIDYKGAQSTTLGAANGTTTSGISFKADEDLGGGMKAGVQWNASLDLSNTGGRTSGTTAVGTTSNVTTFLGNGNSFMYVGGGFGTFKLGTPDLSTYNTNLAANGGFATAIGSGYRITSFDAVRAQNALRYESPSFGGVNFTVHAVTKNITQTAADHTASGNNVNQLRGRDGLTELSLNFTQGPLFASYVRLDMTQDASSNPLLMSESAGGVVSLATATGYTGIGAKFALDTLAATYQLGGAKLGAFVQKTSSDNSGLYRTSANSVGYTTAYFDRNAAGVSVAYAVNPALTLRVGYQQVTLGDTDSGTSGATAGKTTTATGLGLDYSLSKRTTAYLRYETDKDEAGLRSTTSVTGTTTGNTTYTAAAVGIRHAF